MTTTITTTIATTGSSIPRPNRKDRNPTSTQANQVLYYALGGGHGHAVRGMAILRQLRRDSPAVRGTLIVPSRLRKWAEQEQVSALSPPSECRDRERLSQWMSRTLSDLAPDRMLVDVFPSGLLGELTGCLDALARPPWLVTRRVRPTYYLSPPIRTALERCYERVIWCEEPTPELKSLRVPQIRVFPVLIRDRDECLSRADARYELRMSQSDKIVLVLGTGEKSFQKDLLRLLVKIRSRLVERRIASSFILLLVSDELPCRFSRDVAVVRRFPALPLLAAANIVVAAGGYQSFHETQLLGVPAVFLPRHRVYDDQHSRVRRAAVANSPQALEKHIRCMLRSNDELAPRKNAANGAAQIANLLIDAP
jgi:UDP:flavonoid glycosyltransferase YjiC (YdhE family)